MEWNALQNQRSSVRRYARAQRKSCRAPRGSDSRLPYLSRYRTHCTVLGIVPYRTRYRVARDALKELALKRQHFLCCMYGQLNDMVEQSTTISILISHSDIVFCFLTIIKKIFSFRQVYKIFSQNPHNKCGIITTHFLPFIRISCQRAIHFFTGMSSFHFCKRHQVYLTWVGDPGARVNKYDECVYHSSYKLYYLLHLCHIY